MSSKDLPVEILHHVFKYLPRAQRYISALKANYIDKRVLSECILVSKKWKRPAQIIMYKHLTIFTYSALELLLETLKNKQELANTTKSLQIGISIKEVNVELLYMVEELFSCLPNLEAVTFSDTKFCLPMLNVLTDSKLPRLRSMSTAYLKSNFGDFITCALLAKKQLETLNVLENLPVLGEYDEIHMNRLYSRLKQFEKLSELFIWKGSSGNHIEFMESVTESCPALKKLGFYFLVEDYTEEENTITINEIKPRNDIKCLKCIGNTKDMSRHLFYTMEKYPELNELSLRLLTSGTAPKIDVSLLSQLTTYLSKIKSVEVNRLLVEFDSIIEPIGLFWRSCKTGIAYCNFMYSQSLPSGVAELTLRKTRTFPNYTAVDYSLNNMIELGHINLIKNYGNLIGGLVVSGLENFRPETESIKDIAFGQFVADIFKHCPKIEQLTILTCLLKKINVCEGSTSKRFILERFELSENLIHDGVLNSFSKFISKVNDMELTSNKFRDISGKYNSTITIDMPYTKIVSLSLFNSRNPHRGTRYIFVKLSTQLEGDRFYMYDALDHEQDSILKPSSEQEYQDDKNSKNTHVFVTCESINALDILQDDLLFAELRK